MSHPFFNVLANEIGRGVAHAFQERFERAIGVAVELRPGADGKPRPHFSFQLDKPGLLPTALERAFFDGAIAGFRTCINIAMEIEEEFPSLKPPVAKPESPDAYAETRSSIEIDFAAPVHISQDQQQRLVEIAGEICDAYEAKHPDRVMWPSGIGDKMTANPLMIGDDEAIPFDASVFHVECFERENYDYVGPGEEA